MDTTNYFTLDSRSNVSGIGIFPDFNIPESKKKEDYHRRFVDAITSASINNSFDLSYSIMNENYEHYNGTQSGDEFKFLQEADDGEILPAQWINYNKIKVKVDIPLGELDAKGYNIRVRAINKEASVRKFNIRENMRIGIRMRPVAQEIEDNYDIPMGVDNSLPETEEQLDAQFDNFQEKSEVIVEYALKYLDKKMKWRYLRIALFRDLLIAGRCFVKCEIVNGYPTIRRVDPRNMIFDIHATDDLLSDSTYFGEVQYMSAADAAQQYGLSIDELKEAYSSYLTKDGVMVSDASLFNIGTSSMKFFKKENGELRVMVLHAYWQDYKRLKKKKSYDKYGNEHFKDITDKEEEGDSVEAKLIKVWRRGTLIGGKILKKWGEVPNQVRSIDDFYESDCPYKGLIPNYINNRGVSKVELMKSLQKLKNITLYNVQLAMARAGAKGFVYDLAQLPENMELAEVTKYLKKSGIAFIDSSAGGLGAQYNQFNTIDMTISDSVQRYLEISMMCDREMDAITGINDARQGQSQGASQTVGVTKAMLVQSNMATETLFAEFQIFASSVWTHVAGLFKLAFEDPDKFANIVGETGINFFKEELELELDDYAVFIEEINPVLQDNQLFAELVTVALQQGMVDFVDAMKLLREPDVTKGIREFEIAYNKKAQEAVAAKQQEAQMEQQARAEQQERLLAMQAQSQDKAIQGDMGKEQAKGQNKIQEILTKGRVDLRGRQVDSITDQQKIAADMRKAEIQAKNKNKPQK